MQRETEHNASNSTQIHEDVKFGPGNEYYVLLVNKSKNKTVEYISTKTKGTDIWSVWIRSPSIACTCSSTCYECFDQGKYELLLTVDRDSKPFYLKVAINDINTGDYVFYQFDKTINPNYNTVGEWICLDVR